MSKLAARAGCCFLCAMADPPSKTPPTLTPKAEAEQQARRDREAAALRENLRRRKAQSRARQDTEPESGSR